jgi:hypothetical protein
MVCNSVGVRAVSGAVVPRSADSGASREAVSAAVVGDGDAGHDGSTSLLGVEGVVLPPDDGYVGAVVVDVVVVDWVVVVVVDPSRSTSWNIIYYYT